MSHSINTLIAEDKAVRDWEREMKNKILRMANEDKKQKEWNLYFKREEPDDSYLENNIF